MGHRRNPRGNQNILADKWKKHNNPKSLGHSKSSSKREVYKDSGNKKNLKHSNPTLKELEKALARTEDPTQPKINK